MSQLISGPKVSDAIARRMSAGLMAVRARTRYLHEHFGTAESKWKHDGTRVTAIDLTISRLVFEELRAKFPEDQYFSEETEPGGAPVPLTSPFTWIIDPIDGTNNYALGVPVCAISLALLEHGVPVCGFVYDLGTRSLVHGGPGIGVFADGAPIQRHPTPTSDMKIVAMHCPIDARHMPVVTEVLQRYKLRAYGSGALHLTYVALGRVDACLDFTVRVWDIAAAAAFCAVNGVDLWFFNGPVFPLKAFDLHMQPIRYLAADAEAMAELRDVLRDKL